jgi:hypothetical protein
MSLKWFFVFILSCSCWIKAEARLPGIDLRFKRFEILTGLGFGQYSASDPYYNVAFKTTPTIYGLGFYGGTMDRTWGVTATRGSYVLLDHTRQSFTTMASLSYRLGQINEKQNYFFVGPYFRSLTFSRDLSIDGVNLSSTYMTQFSPGFMVSYQRHWGRSFLFFTQLGIDIPVFTSATASPDQFTQVGGSLNEGAFAEVSQHAGVGAELQLRLDRSSTMNGPDKTYTSTFEASFLFKYAYLF